MMRKRSQIIVIDDMPSAISGYLAGSNSGVWDGWLGCSFGAGVDKGDGSGCEGKPRCGPSGAVIGSDNGTTVCRRTGSPMFAMLALAPWGLVPLCVERLRFFAHGLCALNRVRFLRLPVR